MRVLIATVESPLASVVNAAARTLWPECATDAVPAAAALTRFAASPPDLAIVGVGVPATSGLAICRRLRASHPRLPLLAIVSREGSLDEVRALDAGADNCFPAGGDHLVLLARLRALARRAGGPAETPARASDASLVAIDDLVVDLRGGGASLGGRPIALTATEYVLLAALAAKAGASVPHDELLQRVWGPTYTRKRHYLKVYVNRLRGKLGDDARYPRYLWGQRGVGYRLGPALH